jgi:hypothetical protein
MFPKGEHVQKPQGYRQAAAESCFCLLVLFLPHYQSLLFQGIGQAIGILLLTCLLMFLVDRSPEIYRAIAAGLKALLPSWFTPILRSAGRWVSAPSRTVVLEPSLAPTFQRPPPIFS